MSVRSHGFFRLFGFEGILCLVVLNAPHWFDRPTAPIQLASWTLLAASLALAIHGFHVLRTVGKPTAPAPGSDMHRIEHTTVLVSVGAYRYVRHPLYTSAVVGTCGVVLKAPSALAIGIGLLATAFWVATAKIEEAENLVRFGNSYRTYMAHTRLFIPFLF
ncbi:MAG: isoprenylcysteine carboxylmethyltransferase family protein [Terriglobia bacterium]